MNEGSFIHKIGRTLIGFGFDKSGGSLRARKRRSASRDRANRGQLVWTLLVAIAMAATAFLQQRSQFRVLQDPVTESKAGVARGIASR